MNVGVKWNTWKYKIAQAVKHAIPVEYRRNHKLWITQEILDSIDERRKIKDCYMKEYKQQDEQKHKKMYGS